MRKLHIIFVAGLVACCATSALAQTPRPNRPYRGLFGGGVANTEQLLTVSFGAAAGYDDDVLLGQSGGTHPTPGNGAASGLAEGSWGLSYSASRTRAAFSASYGGAAAIYPGLNQSAYQRYYMSQGANANGTFEISDKTRLSASVQ